MNSNQDRILDEYLKLASEEYLEQVEADNDEIMENYQDYEYPSSLDSWFKNEIIRVRRKKRNEKWQKKLISFSRRTAAVLAVIILMGGILILSVDALGVDFLNLFVTETDKYEEFKFDDNNGLLTIAQDNNLKYYPSMLPEGFKLESFEISNLVYRYTFSKEDAFIFLAIHKGRSDIRLDNENGVISDISIKNIRGKISRADGRIMILIKVDNYIIYAIGDTEEEILIKLLEDVI